jgi:GT2 family glycosyltransferase
MKITVLIPTYNRKDWLLKTLACIAKQTYSYFEVIIVDASMSEDQLLADDLEAFNFQVDYIRYGIAGNVSKQRNIALQRASGDILLFLDDDVTFEENLFLNYSKLFTSGKYQAITGLVETEKYKRGSTPIVFATNRFLNIGRPNYQPCDMEINSYVICTANFAFLKSVYEQVGGFDENIFGIFDDVDFGFLLESKGIPVIHHPLVSVFHFQAKANGARSSSLPGWWHYYNISYFHLKNLKPNSGIFLLACSWQLLRPSRSWLKPIKVIRNYRNFIEGYFRAIKCLNLRAK